MTTPKLPWWQSDTYDIVDPVPQEFLVQAGPQSVALVKAYEDDRTDEGWGLQGAPLKDRPGFKPGFMEKYLKGDFGARRALFGYNKNRHNFAFVMRSVSMICIDIDGKNGGLEHAKRLGALPLTLAETSKSGDGYHLFYEVAEEWDDKLGFGRLSDRIGIEQGVDIRATGCVYHHPQQRWNDRAVAPLPKHLYELLTQREQKQAATAARIQGVLAAGDDMEVLMMQDQLVSELAKPIPAGKRNNTLFAIGSQMREAQVPKWDELLAKRGDELGLGVEEIDKLVTNITRYSGTTP